MNQIPNTKKVLVLRTDFSNDATWELLCKEIIQPSGEFKADVEFLSDREFENSTIKQILSLAPQKSEHSFIFVADGDTFTNPEHPVLVVDLLTEPGQTFRVIPSEMWGVENNLSLANMDFYEFAENVDEDGIFRGFDFE